MGRHIMCNNTCAGKNTNRDIYIYKCIIDRALLVSLSYHSIINVCMCYEFL